MQCWLLLACLSTPRSHAHGMHQPHGHDLCVAHKGRSQCVCCVYELRQSMCSHCVAQLAASHAQQRLDVIGGHTLCTILHQAMHIVWGGWGHNAGDKALLFGRLGPVAVRRCHLLTYCLQSALVTGHCTAAPSERKWREQASPNELMMMARAHDVQQNLGYIRVTHWCHRWNLLMISFAYQRLEMHWRSYSTDAALPGLVRQGRCGACACAPQIGHCWSGRAV